MGSSGRRGVVGTEGRGTDRADAGCGCVGVVQGREYGVGGIGRAVDQDAVF